MDALEVLDLIERAESSTIQLKKDITNATQLASEMVAFSNSKGGVIIIGVSDDKEIKGLSDADIGRLNQLISNSSEQNVRPPISPITEIVKIENNKVLVLQINEGVSKPYCTNEGIYWAKKGSDKRKISQDELQRLFQDSSRIYADEQILAETSIADINKEYFEEFYEKDYGETLNQSGLEIHEVFDNLKLGLQKKLRLGGLLLFGKKPEKYKPAFIIKAISFLGTDPTGTDYRDSEDIKGNLINQYEDALSFIMRNMRKIQDDKGFNTEGEPEIPKLVFEELLVNALVHRDYYINSPITIFIFDNRIEITSPGKLPNNLTVENIKRGVSVIRNPILTSFGSRILPYRGVGTGVRRSIENYPKIEFLNDEDAERFNVIIQRPEV